eukprot:scaffold874_cov380-Prasinococcus_capsulatus_cf.AAC.23
MASRLAALRMGLPILVPVRDERVAAQLNLVRGIRALLVDDNSASVPEEKLIHPQKEYVDEMRLSLDERAALYHAFSVGLIGRSQMDGYDLDGTDDGADPMHDVLEDLFVPDVIMVLDSPTWTRHPARDNYENLRDMRVRTFSVVHPDYCAEDGTCLVDLEDDDTAISTQSDERVKLM